MNKIILILLSFVFAITFLIKANSIALADGMNDDSKDYYITYIEYSIYNENGNIIKSVKKGELVITKENEEPALDEDDEFRILPIREKSKDHKPTNRKPRPIIPIIETHEG